MKHSEATQAEALRLRTEQGLSMDDIAKALHISKSTVCEWLRGIPLPKNAPKPDPLVSADDLGDLRGTVIRLHLDHGWGVARIKQATGATYNDCYRWILELKQATAAPVMNYAPPDTRTLGQRLCGDPIFERSALYQKQVGR